MKIAISLLIVLVLLCGCSQNQIASQIDVADFSYTEDYADYSDDSIFKQDGFVNTEKTEIKTSEQAVELAKKECTVEYDAVDVAYDEELKIYKVSFSKKDAVGGNQDVFINQDGTTELIVFGE